MKKIIFIVLVIGYLSGCSEEPLGSKTKIQLTTINSTIQKQQNRIERLETREKFLQFQISRLQNQSTELSSKMDSFQNSLAIFTPSSKGYTTINTKLGNFLVSLQSLTKYANGYKAVFNIGNPNQVTFSELKINVGWGENIPPSNISSDPQKKFKTNEITINKPILPGMWNKISIILAPATAKETGIIALTITADKILLTEDYRKSMT